MDLLLLALIALAIVALISGQRQRAAQQRARQRGLEADLALVRRTLDEDVTVLGEELQRLDADLPVASAADEAVRADHQRALDAYEAAKESAEAMRSPDDAGHVTAILDDGRYAIACVRARVAGEVLPARRPPCFFDPRHGPSVTDVDWSPAAGSVRQVPACAADAERVTAGGEPHTRQVMLGSQRVPYWQAGPALAPMTMGYFGAFGIAQSLFLGTTMGMMLGGGFYGGESDSGGDDGTGGDDGSSGDGGSDGGGDSYDAAGYDGGGYDGGGYDGGGFDGGGFDGGGFDGF